MQQCHIQYVAGDKSRAGYLQTGMMYLFAGHIAGGDFVLPQYQDEFFPALHKRWHPTHRARVQQLDEEVKTRRYDELHNAKGVPFIFPMLETENREERKFGVRTVLSSQYFRDMPEALRQSANNVYMVGVDPEDRRLLKERFKVPDVTLDRFERMGSGVPFLGIFRIKGGSTIAHIMKNTVGPEELWGHSTTPVDMSLRRMLEADVGAETARRILGRFFPNGSAEKVIAHRQRTAGETGGGSVIRALATELINQQGYDL